MPLDPDELAERIRQAAELGRNNGGPMQILPLLRGADAAQKKTIQTAFDEGKGLGQVSFAGRAQAPRALGVDDLKTIDSDSDPEFMKLKSNGEFSPEGWFLYFWREAKANIGRVAGQDRPALNQMTATFFVRDNDRIKVAPAVRRNQAADAGPDFDAWLARDPQNVRDFGAWLKILLKAGFQPFLADKAEFKQQRTQGSNPSGELAAVENLALAKEFVSTPFTWRADTRPLSSLRGEGGFNTKADQNKDWSATHNLRAPWNPFSDPEINKHYWFRRASNDNCKYSVVSVGIESDWRKVISFPRLCDLHEWPADLFARGSGSLQPFDKLSPVDQKKVSDWYKWGWMLPALCLIDGKTPSRPVLLPAVRTNLYLLILGGVVLNTNKVQGKEGFPEVGVKSLSLRNIYGAIEVVRFYHGGDDPHGYTAFVVGGEKVANEGRSKRFQATEKQLEAAYRDLERQIGSLNMAWAANGSTTVPASFTYMGRKLQVIGYNRTAQPMQCEILW